LVRAEHFDEDFIVLISNFDKSLYSKTIVNGAKYVVTVYRRNKATTAILIYFAINYILNAYNDELSNGIDFISNFPHSRRNMTSYGIFRP